MQRSLLAALSLLASATIAPAAETLVTTFSSGNIGNWTYGPPPIITTTGGNPGAFLRTSVDTFAPQVRTQGTSVFTGDYRQTQVESLGVDVIVQSTQFAASRPLSIILSSGACQVAFTGAALVPQPGQGWASFEFAIPSQSTTLPAGWISLSPCSTPDADWNTVMQNVTEVRFFYGDPTFFFIFDIWNTGIDNPRISRTSPWTDLGNAKPGSNGLPLLLGTGTLLPGTPVGIDLTNAAPSATAFLFVSPTAANLPLLGGTLVPDPAPPGFATALITSPAGAIAINTTFPAGVPSGVSLYLQYWIADAGATLGAAASNAIRGVVP